MLPSQVMNVVCEQALSASEPIAYVLRKNDGQSTALDKLHERDIKERHTMLVASLIRVSQPHNRLDCIGITFSSMIPSRCLRASNPRSMPWFQTISGAHVGTASMIKSESGLPAMLGLRELPASRQILRSLHHRWPRSLLSCHPEWHIAALETSIRFQRAVN